MASSQPLLHEIRPAAKERTKQRVLRNFSCVVGLVAVLGAGYWYLLHPRPADTNPRSADNLHSCGTKADCLKIIDDYFLHATRQTYAAGGAGLVQTYGPGSIGGGPCGDELCKLVEPCPNYALSPHCRFDVYDNALAAIYLTKRGKLGGARQVLDAFILLLYPTGDVTPGLDYGAGALLPSERSLTLLAAGYTEVETVAGEYQGAGVADGVVDTGNNAWVGMAFAHYAAATGDACYSVVAHDLLAALSKSTQCRDDLQGFGSRLAPYPQFYRSTEHNTDMFALSRMLGAAGAESAMLAGSFVRGMWARLPEVDLAYAVGTGGAKQCDTTVPSAPAAVDAQFWNLLANADPDPGRKAISMNFTVQEASKGSPAQGLWATDIDIIGNASGTGRGAVLHGVRFTTRGNGIQWENTASAVMAMKHYQLHYDAGDKLELKTKINAARDSLKHLLSIYGSIPSSVLGGNIAAYTNNNHTSQYPGGSDTGIGWTYLRYPHAASTAWAGLMLIYQFDDADSVREDANPFAPPATTVPDPEDSGSRTCLPSSSKMPRSSPASDNGAACSAYPGCVGRRLSGDCCPTEEGMLLGCCSEDFAPPASPPKGKGSDNEPAYDPHGTPGGQSRARVAERAANSGCTHLGLTGACCPTSEGTMLGCC